MDDHPSGHRGAEIALSGQSHDSSAQFQPGTVVEVMPRLWPGMNKQGGTARITKVSYDQGWPTTYTFLQLVC
jgi:hypothetical protein